jgi:hypothetical protein
MSARLKEDLEEPEKISRQSIASQGQKFVTMPEDGEKATADSKAAVYPNLCQVQAATPGTSGQAGNPFTGTLFRRDSTSRFRGPVSIPGTSRSCSNGPDPIPGTSCSGKVGLAATSGSSRYSNVVSGSKVGPDGSKVRPDGSKVGPEVGPDGSEVGLDAVLTPEPIVGQVPINEPDNETLYFDLEDDNAAESQQ